MLRKLLLVTCFLFIVGKMYAQTCTALGQNPGTAFPVCGSSVFNQNTVPVCGSTIVPAPCSTVGLFQDKNPFWYTFTCFSSGLLAFVITPNNLSDDYDWQLFDITGHSPADVYTDNTLFVACNWSGDSGNTGASTSGVSLVNCEGFGVPTFSSRPNLIVGHIYLLLVSHFTNSQSGYGLSFGGGTAVITDTTAPKLASATASCDGSKIIVRLNKPMKCSSLVANGNDFVVTGTTSTITSATGVNCTAGFDMDTVILSLNTPLTSGSYNVVIKNGTDGNTLLDICNTPIPFGNSVPLFFAASQPPFIDSIAPLGCAPDALLIHFSTPIQCSSVAANGSDFIMSGTSSSIITGATVTCSGTSTSVVKLQLSAPLYRQGSNTIKVKTGSDGNTVISVCGLQAIVGDSIVFTTPADTVSANFSFNIKQGCTADTVSFFSSSSNGINQWQWLFGSATSSQQNPVHIYTTFGTQQVQLIVSNGVCSDTVQKSLNLSPPVAIVTLIREHAAKCGGSNGSAQVIASGGAGGYTYLWTPGNYSTDSISNLAPSMYIVTVKDSRGCTKIDTAIITTQSSPQITSLSHTDVLCHGLANGTATATVTNGVPPYSYLWSHGATTYTGNPLANIDTGTYTLLVTDSNGCIATGSVTINQSQALAHNVSVYGTSCARANGAAAIHESGGTTPYIYTWSPAGNADSSSGLNAGNYVVSITDANGCADSVHVQIASSNPLTAAIINIKPVTCFGGNDGSATATANGTAPYTYAWLPAGGTNAIASGLSAGNYVVQVTDSKGCFDTATVLINAGAVLRDTIVITNTTCGNNNGAATATAFGGTAPYSYFWSPATPGSSITNLVPGVYVVTITDSKGCTKKDSVTIAASPVPQITAINRTDVLCYGAKNGTATAVITNGLSPYTYSWSHGTNVYTGNPLQNMDTGFYTLTVTDANGCTDTDSGTINQPQQLAHIVTAQGTSCALANGSASITESGGIAPYSFAWSPSGGNGNSASGLATGNYVVSITDAKGCADSVHLQVASSNPLVAVISNIQPVICFGGNDGTATATANGTAPYTYIWSPSGGTNATASGLSAGTYIVKVTDSKGCSDTASVQINAGLAISVNIIKTNASCISNNGTATATASGGHAPYSYLWSSGGAGSAISNLAPGKYTVTVTDSKGCIKTDSVTITTGTGPQITAINHTNVVCKDFKNGTANAVVTNGTLPYNYLWVHGANSFNTNPLSNLDTGKYVLTVTDANGCIATGNVTLSFTHILGHSAIATGTKCALPNGSVVIHENGGSAPYTYSWSPSGGNADTASGLAPGNYSVAVKDTNGCADTAYAVVASSNPLTAVAGNINSVTCKNLNNGSATITANGTPPYSYAWSPTGGINATAAGLAAGAYNVMVTDNLGCTATVALRIDAANPLTISVSGSGTSCGNNNGIAIASASGGKAPYGFAWSSGISGNEITDLAPGVYNLTVTDASGCKVYSYAKINASVPLHPALGNETSICRGSELILSPGIFTSYSWQDSSHNPTLSIVRGGLYSVTVSDTTGCKAYAQIRVNENCLDILFPDAFTPNGDGRNDEFGALGTLSAIKNYSFRVYNRWGQLTFSSNNPYKKWDGKSNGSDAGTGTFVWIAEYSFNNEPRKMQRGTIVLMK